jgi:hypothetical protein
MAMALAQADLDGWLKPLVMFVLPGTLRAYKISRCGTSHGGRNQHILDGTYDRNASLEYDINIATINYNRDLFCSSTYVNCSHISRVTGDDS